MLLLPNIVSVIIQYIFKMALLLMLLHVYVICNCQAEGSHCMVTTSGAQHGPSLYLRLCCANSNLGQTV